MKGSLVVFKGPKKNGLCYRVGEIVCPHDSSSLTIIVNKFELWHNKMGHIGNKWSKIST